MTKQAKIISNIFISGFLNNSLLWWFWYGNEISKKISYLEKSNIQFSSNLTGSWHSLKQIPNFMRVLIRCIRRSSIDLNSIDHLWRTNKIYRNYDYLNWKKNDSNNTPNPIYRINTKTIVFTGNQFLWKSINLRHCPMICSIYRLNRN